MALRMVVLLAALLLAVEAKAQNFTRLYLYWGGEREDNFTLGTMAGANDATGVGYVFWRTEACLPIGKSGYIMRPLDVWFHDGLGDNYTTATPAGSSDAQSAGYRFVRTEGFVAAYQYMGMVPLYSYWHAGRGDYFTTATTEGMQDAIGEGYQFVRVEGYVYPANSIHCWGSGP